MAKPPRSGTSEETATLVRSQRKPRPLAAVIRVVGGKSPPFLLVSGSALVGSAPPCDIVIADPTVSRTHAELSLVPEGVAVRDLGSHNGTFYLGQRLEKMVLRLGARLEIGGAVLAIEADSGSLAEPLEIEGDSYRNIVGASPAMRRVFGVLARLEGSLVGVLVEGESGVGKEVVARALHDASLVQGPLVAVNCGAFPRELVASELFGHRKGAFTGAIEQRKGAFEAADGGTLFLDEIGELPLEVQPMLLRALDAGEIRPVGDDKSRQVKVRVVAATNRDLEREIREGRFREDLFYRLAVVRIAVPPLRERREDIEPLARRFAEAAGLAPLPPDVLERLKARAWPGNARELRNAVQVYGAIGALPEPGRSGSDALTVVLREVVDAGRPLEEQRAALDELFTKLYLEALLQRTRGNQTVAARIAGMDRGYIGRLIAKHGLGKPT